MDDFGKFWVNYSKSSDFSSHFLLVGIICSKILVFV